MRAKNRREKSKRPAQNLAKKPPKNFWPGTRVRKKPELSLRARALQYLARREYSRAELRGKLLRYTRALEVIWRVFRAKREELMIAGIVIVVLLAVSSCLMYFAERGAQPDHYSDIPSAMWWAVVTITTVGYGDIVPVTPVGRLLASLVALLGVATIALPTAILGAGFVHEFQHRHIEHCPHCGKRLRRTADES